MIERSIRIEEERYRQLRAMAEAESLPVSYLLRFAVSHLVCAYGRGVSLADFAKAVDRLGKTN